MNFHSMVLSEIREGHILHGIAYVCNLKNKSPIYKNRVQEWLSEAGIGGIGRGTRVQTFSYKMNKV